MVLNNLLDSLREIYAAPADTAWKAGPAEVLFMSADVNRADVVGGVAVDRVLDPLRLEFERMGYTTATVSRPGSSLIGEKTLSNSLSLSRRFLWRRLFRSFRILLTARGTNPMDTVSRDYARTFIELFRRINPKLILMINSFDGTCEAAFHCRIPILEVLHARGYGEVSEVQERQELCHLPDGIIAYDDVSAETFGSVLPCLRVPNFRLSFELEMARQFLQDTPPPFAEAENQYRQVVLFTANYDPSDLSWRGGLPRELIELIGLDRTVFLMVRLHPVMRIDPQYAEARESLQEELRNFPNCDVEWASSAPLYAVLQAATVHFTFDSMSAYEAADVGLATYAIDSGKHVEGKRFNDLKVSGKLVGISTELSEFQRAIAKPISPFPHEEPEQGIDIQCVLEFAAASSTARWRLLGDPKTK